VRTVWPALVLLSCSSRLPVHAVASVAEQGIAPNPPGAAGRDSGMSARFGGHSVWLYGDTFFSPAASDGYRWRSSTWSWTDDLTSWQHALDADGRPAQALPHTADEQAFDDAHNGDRCPAQNDCGARHTPWPAGGFVVDPATGTAWVPYNPMSTEPTGQFAFTSQGTSLATWASPAAPAVRPSVMNGAGPQLLFGADEPAWGAGALIVDGALLLYACGGSGDGCQLARAPLESALDRSAWTFWDGKSWVTDWHQAQTLFDGAPYVTVAFNTHVGKYLAWYMPPFNETLCVREADRPEGPWSAEQHVGIGQHSMDPQNWDYALVAHPELDRDDGRIVTLSYFQPGTFLNGTIHLVEVTFQ
jgi:hypothetical protein